MIEFFSSLPVMVAGIMSVLTALITILGTLEKRRNNRNKDFLHQMNEMVDKALEGVDRTNAEQQNSIAQLSKDVKEVGDKVDNVDKKVCELDKKVDELDEKVDLLDKKVELIDTRVNTLELGFTAIDKQIKSLDRQLKYQQEDILDNELSRLQTAIVDFASQLRCGLVPNTTSFEYLFHNYDRYKQRGGNSFIDSEMKFIKEYKEKIERN